LRLEGQPDPVRLEFFYDAQTSGGLLISVAADKVDKLTQALKAKGALASSVIGEVMERNDATLIVR